MSKPIVFLLPVLFLTVGLRPANLAAADTKASFEKKCSSCHAKDGKGNPKVINLLNKDSKGNRVDISKLSLVDEETSQKSDVQLAKITRDGVDNSKMKGYKDQFSDEEIAELVKYIRSLKK